MPLTLDLARELRRIIDRAQSILQAGSVQDTDRIQAWRQLVDEAAQGDPSGFLAERPWWSLVLASTYAGPFEAHRCDGIRLQLCAPISLDAPHRFVLWLGALTSHERCWVALSGESVAQAIVEADERFPLPSWWSDHLRS